MKIDSMLAHLHHHDDVLKTFTFENVCSVGGEKIETGVLWPPDSDEQWFVCPDHLLGLQARYEKIKFKESTTKLLEEFRKK